MKIFITGATGSIGAHLVKMLSERGHTCHVLVRSLAKAELLDFPNVVAFQGDITDPRSIDKAMQGCQQAYHLAALAKVWAKDSGIFYRINVDGTVNVLEAAVKHQLDRVVVCSTGGVFGPSIHAVVKEDKARDIDIFNEYEGSKAMAESRVKDFVIEHDLDVVIVSPTRVYGPFLFGEPSSTTLMVDKFVNEGWRIYPGTGHELGNYVYIEDVALGHILAMEKGRKGHTYILGGDNYDYFQFYKLLGEAAGIQRKMFTIPMGLQVFFAKIQLFMAEYLGKEPMITPKWIAKAKYHWEVSPAKAVKELGLPITPIAEGLKKTVAYVRARKKV